MVQKNGLKPIIEVYLPDFAEIFMIEYPDRVIVNRAFATRIHQEEDQELDAAFSVFL